MTGLGLDFGSMSDAPAPAGPDGMNRRTETRAPIELRVEYRQLNSFFADYTRNISRGGTFIKTPRPLDIGTEFRFELVLPGQTRPVSLLGVVRWVIAAGDAGPSQDAGMGIEFVFRDLEERRHIHAAVEEMMKKSLGEHLVAKLVGEDS